MTEKVYPVPATERWVQSLRPRALCPGVTGPGPCLRVHLLSLHLARTWLAERVGLTSGLTLSLELLTCDLGAMGTLSFLGTSVKPRVPEVASASLALQRALLLQRVCVHVCAHACVSRRPDPDSSLPRGLGQRPGM